MGLVLFWVQFLQGRECKTRVTRCHLSARTRLVCVCVCVFACHNRQVKKVSLLTQWQSLCSHIKGNYHLLKTEKAEFIPSVY